MSDASSDLVLGEFILELKKSTLPASAAEEGGNFDFFCSSPVKRMISSWIQDGPAILMGTGGKASVHYGFGKFSYSTDTWAFSIKQNEYLNEEFLYRLLEYELDYIDYAGFEGSGLRHLRKGFIKKIRLALPSRETQEKLVSVFKALDSNLDSISRMIQKYQDIQVGLTQDLISRGILPNGKLRPDVDQSPELYKDTEIGRVPMDWEIKDIEEVLESLIDGPFGSNLKTEHYVVDPGVRVIRLQNLSEYIYADGDKVFISARHAASLTRNRVVGGDVLIAGLGEERYPIGRSCIYPESLPFAINKADCFRARCLPGVMKNQFLMLFLNSEFARKQIRRYEQGVTRPRINTGNLKRLKICVPAIAEQIACIEKFKLIESTVIAQRECLDKIRNQKYGLMQDLLMGKVKFNERKGSKV